jgi:K+-sensing histidine kinase KdpD
VSLERRLKELAQASLRIHASLSADDVLAAAAAEARALLGVHVAVCHLEEAAAPPRIQASLSGAYPSLDRVPAGELTWLEAPMAGPASAWRGGVRVAAPVTGDFREDDETILGGIAEVAAVAIENARVHRVIEDAARSHDVRLQTLAHDLRNHLNTIAMSTALLRDHLATREMALVERIQRAANRMNLLLAEVADAMNPTDPRLRVPPPE